MMGRQRDMFKRPELMISRYFKHLRTIFDRQLENDMVEEDGCVLPECFRPPPGTSGSMGLEAPKDAFARAG